MAKLVVFLTLALTVSGTQSTTCKSTQCNCDCTVTHTGVCATDAEIQAEVQALGGCSTILAASGGTCAGVGPYLRSLEPLLTTATCEDHQDSSDNPCFGRDSTFTCRMTADSSPSDAYDQCFGAAEPTVASRVRMSELRAGDHVLTLDHGVPAATRVLLNQHVADASSSSVTTLHHANGSLTVTPDHVLRIDGAFAPARTAHVGSVLSMHGGDSVVTRVSGGATEGIINPITTSGTVLAADETGAPVLASVYGEWIASYLLNSRSLYPLPASLGSGLSLLFPSLVQAYYDSLLEPAFMAGAKDLKAIKAGAPTPVVGVIILGFDVLLAVGFAAYVLAVNPVVTATLAVGFAAARRSSNAKKVA